MDGRKKRLEASQETNRILDSATKVRDAIGVLRDITAVTAANDQAFPAFAPKIPAATSIEISLVSVPASLRRRH